MKQTGTCPKCGSTDIIADAKAVDRGHGGAILDLSVATFRKPEAIFFKQRRETSLSAWVCAGCGFVEFYADDAWNIQLPMTQNGGEQSR